MSIENPKALEFNSSSISDELALSLYEKLLFPRLIEEKMLLLRRQGRITKWFSGIGQEAVSVGATSALHADEYILPRIRNLGVFTTRGVSLNRLFSQFEGKLSGFTSGRDRTFHFNSKEDHIIAAPSLLGPQLEIALGLALSAKLQGQKKVVLAFSGDGESSQGAFHEALNVASVWKLPVIFLLENNGYALSTPSMQQYACEKLSDRAAGYGMAGVSISGNNVLEVYSTVERYAKLLRNEPQAVLIECETFRMRGHEEGSGTDYVPKELQSRWSKLDPLTCYQDHLVSLGLLTEAKIEALKSSFNDQIEQAREFALSQDDVEADTHREVSAVYASSKTNSSSSQPLNTRPMRMIDAINLGIEQAMLEDPKLVIMGQDIAGHGGVFKATKSLVEQFGEDRVRNTPLCESAILGTAVGLSIEGIPSIVELQFADFSVCGMNQLVNVYSKWFYRSAQELPIVVRMPSGAGVGAGPLHSASYEAWFANTPGLKIVYPSNPRDAKGLLASAIKDPNPVLFFEHKALYRNREDEVGIENFCLPIGSANVVTLGEQASIITYGLGVEWAKEFIESNKHLSIELIDLRTLVPLDFETIKRSIAKTARALVLYEAPKNSGFGAEIAARVSEECFSLLDAPVIRCANLDTPVPQAHNLEQSYLAKSRLEEKILELLSY